MGREARIKAQRAAAAAAAAPPAGRTVKLKDAQYWELDSRCRRTQTAQQNVASAMQELREAQAAQNELVTKLAREYRFEPTNAQFGLNDKARTITLLGAAAPAPVDKTAKEKKKT